MYGSHLKVLGLTCSAHMVIFAQIQKLKNSPSVEYRIRHNVESDQAPFHMLVQHSHYPQVLFGYRSSHATTLQDITHDIQPHKITQGSILTKHKSQTTTAFTGYLRPHTTLIHDVAYDLVSVEAHLTWNFGVTHDSSVQIRTRFGWIPCLHFSFHMRHLAANDINIHDVSNHSWNVINPSSSHTTLDQTLNIAHEILLVIRTSHTTLLL